MVTSGATGVLWRISIALGLACAIASPLFASELQPLTVRAYEQYVETTRRAFLDRVRNERELSQDSKVSLEPIRARPTTLPSPQGTITAIAGGLVHYWAGSTFIPGMGLDRVLAVAQDYDEYATIHRPMLRSRLLVRDGNTYRIFARVKEDAGMVSAVLDVWTVVHYERSGACAHALGEADAIREVRNPGLPTERHLPPGRDSGYLWRANTFTRFVERDGGVFVELETLGLSRRFPAFLGWLIEPIARRIGRGSVERTLNEFRDAVLKTAP
jgi:hypothetical protein